MLIIIIIIDVESDYHYGWWVAYENKVLQAKFRTGLETNLQEHEKKYPELKQKKTGCLGQCKSCRSGCFVMIKSQPIIEDTPDKLFKRLKKIVG